MSDFKAKISAGAPPQTPLGELTALPQTSQLDLKGSTSMVREETEGEGRQMGR